MANAKRVLSKRYVDSAGANTLLGLFLQLSCIPLYSAIHFIGYSYFSGGSLFCKHL